MSLRNFNTTCFESLPDEIILLICGYLSQIDILDSFLNINLRLNQTISSYREKIFLSHLNYQNFHHLLHHHLPFLSSNVNSLYLNTTSMINPGQIFENYFTKLDVEFPLLNELILYQIDIETLENLSWRFNTMKSLRRLSINIADERLASRPILFDEFLFGKLFSPSNSFLNLEIYFSKYFFNLSTIKQRCQNIQQLFISIRNLADLFILFEYLFNLEKLNVTMSCCSSTTDNLIYSNISEQLWWKIPYLTDFSLTLKEDSLTSHDYIPSNELIFKIIQNLYSLKSMKFFLDIRFSSSLQMKTSTEIYVKKYFPFFDGTLWELALKRQDNRNISFEFSIELDGLPSKYVEETYFSDTTIRFKNDNIDFQSHLKATFSSAYWLQKNISIQYFLSTTKHVSIYTLPITYSYRSTIADIIDQDVSIRSSISHSNIENLHIHVDPFHQHSLSLSLKNLMKKFPYLIHLNIQTQIVLPPITTIYSIRLRSLILHDCKLSYCLQILDCLPRVISLSNRYSKCEQLDFDKCKKSFTSILRLKLNINGFLLTDLTNFKGSFPNLKEFYLKIANISVESLANYSQYKIIEDHLSEFVQLRYAEICVPIEKYFNILSNRTEIIPNKCMIERAKTSDSRYFISKHWM